MAEQGPEKSSSNSVGESYRKAGPYLDASWQLIGSVGLWTAIGWFLDGRLGTKPWLLVAGSLLGIGLGFYLFFRALTALGKRK